MRGYELGLDLPRLGRPLATSGPRSEPCTVLALPGGKRQGREGASFIITASLTFPSAQAEAPCGMTPGVLFAALTAFVPEGNFAVSSSLGDPCPAWNPAPVASPNSVLPLHPPLLASPTEAPWSPDS